jgi:hypothetical protein
MGFSYTASLPFRSFVIGCTYLLEICFKTSGSITVENRGTIFQPNNTTTNLNTGNISYKRSTAPL